MGKEKFSEQQIVDAINAALNKTTLEDEEVKKLFYQKLILSKFRLTNILKASLTLSVAKS